MNQNADNITSLLADNRNKINTYIQGQIDKLQSLINFKDELKLFYDMKCAWLGDYTMQVEAAFKKVNLSVVTMNVNVSDNSNNAVDPNFDMPKRFSIGFTAKMVGSRRPIKESYDNSKQLKISAEKLESSLKSAMPEYLNVLSVNVNQYSLEARKDGSAGNVTVNISFK